LNIFQKIKKTIQVIPKRIKSFFSKAEKKIKSFFIKAEKKIDETLFGKPQPKKEEEIRAKPKTKERKPEEEERKPVTLTVSTQIYVSDHTEWVDITRQFPNKQEALQNVEQLAKEALEQNKYRASEIAKSVSYRIDDAPISLVAGRVKIDRPKKRKKYKKTK
jgi:hydroxymethylpyrimidine pyrophosphatase-like HAD family hydrolase